MHDDSLLVLGAEEIDSLLRGRESEIMDLTVPPRNGAPVVVLDLARTEGRGTRLPSSLPSGEGSPCR